jgi:hypothetical protein
VRLEKFPSPLHSRSCYAREVPEPHLKKQGVERNKRESELAFFTVNQVMTSYGEVWN